MANNHQTDKAANDADWPSLPRLDTDSYFAQLGERIEAVLASADEASMRKLGRTFLSVVETGVPATIKLFLDKGMPATYQDPQTGLSALHVAAAARARYAVKLLLATGACDFLLRDKQGRLSSELAFVHGEDPALARLLSIKERKQADAQGIKLTRRP